MEKKYKAIKYIRLSSADEKPGESDSIVNQRKLIDEFLKNHQEIEVVGEKVDDGFSGIVFDRPAFKEMMAEIEQGKVNCCITKDLSRLGREFVETGRYLRRIFPAYGVRFIAINDNIDTQNDKGDDLSVSVKSIMNDEYCRDVSIKTRSALNSKRNIGDYVGACPVYGYKKSVENHNKLVIDDYPADIVRDIFRMKIDGFSAVRIADTLNKRGVLSPYQYKKDRGLPHPRNGFADKENAKWSATTIIRILKDEIYTGTLIQGIYGTPNYKLKQLIKKPVEEWKRTENAHEAIIKKYEFELAGKIMRLDTRTAPHDDKVYAFSGLLICGSCGCRMTRKTVPSKGVKYYYYWCPTTKKRGCKNPVMVKEDELTQCVLENVKSYISNVSSLENIIANIDPDHIALELADKLSEQVGENERQLEKIREFKAGLYENMIGGNLSNEERKTMAAQYDEDAGILIKSNEKLRQEIDNALSCKHERLEWLECFREFDSFDVINRKIIVNLIQSIKIISKTEIEIVFNFQSEYEIALALLKSGVA